MQNDNRVDGKEVTAEETGGFACRWASVKLA